MKILKKPGAVYCRDKSALKIANEIGTIEAIKAFIGAIPK